MKKLILIRITLLHLLSVFLLSTAFAQNLTVREIMAEPSIAGMRVENEKLSPDGSKVIYLWNAEGKMPRDLYLVSTSGSEPAKILSVADLPVPSRAPEKENKLDYGLTVRDAFVKERETQLGNFEWSPDSKRLVFSYGGDLYLFTPGSEKPTRLTQTQAAEVGPRFLDNDRILFSQNGNLFIWNLPDSQIRQISKEANQQNFIGVSNPTPNKAGSLVAYVVSDSSKQRALVVPNYLDEFVQSGNVRRGWSEQKVLVVPTDGSRDMPFEVKLPKPEGVSNFRSMKWAADGRSLIVDRVDKDTKRRQLFYIHNVGSKDEQIILVTEETDDKWQAPLSSIVEANPKNPSELFFGSEKDGFNHLYLAKLEENPSPTATPGAISGGNPTDAGFSATPKIVQLTNGNWQVEWAKWNPLGSRIIYLSSEAGTSERILGVVTTESMISKTFENDVDIRRGMVDSPQLADELSSGNEQLIYSLSRWNQPSELIAEKICTLCTSSKDLPERIRLTNTTPDS
ncbi:MAG TPA: DPP IV N-terminal domain-containing protein, partial [Pyrinomonadaceae bacterium]|nr:DPP IV N-terminal domain-containing protein [Pyrinomonadaceae bacterium]